jgi:hypothetical protein
MQDRLHIVLVPGFAGFDALGQLEYYAGVTPVFRQWQSAGKHGRQTALHYFDNFPTASVVTRAGRLRRYLTKRVARGSFQTGDTVALIGHSTGGLDIRRLLWDLAEDAADTERVDGGSEIAAASLLDLIKRVVFLSVPQWGTNIAHWVRQNVFGRIAIVAELRASVAASQIPFLCLVQELASDSATGMLNLDLGHALADALREAETRMDSGPAETAEAQESAAILALWLRHMAWDFAVIDDLCPGSEDSCSPAHFSLAQRIRETAHWTRYGIRTLSYATVSPCPFRFQPGRPASELSLVLPWTWPEFTEKAADRPESDLVYRACYRACAAGPFRYPQPEIPVPDGGRPIQVWDNDGIVNTASMLWPSGSATRLVECDHMDITGHFERVPAENGKPRRYLAYDLLKSGSAFGRHAFTTLWKEVFDFCVARHAAAAGA